MNLPARLWAASARRLTISVTRRQRARQTVTQRQLESFRFHPQRMTDKEM
jgi:hypothetical protein